MAPLRSLLGPQILTGHSWELLLACKQLSFPIGHVEAGNGEAPPHGIGFFDVAFGNFSLDELVDEMIRVLHYIVVVDHAIF